MGRGGVAWDLELTGLQLAGRCSCRPGRGAALLEDVARGAGRSSSLQLGSNGSGRTQRTLWWSADATTWSPVATAPSCRFVPLPVTDRERSSAVHAKEIWTSPDGRTWTRAPGRSGLRLRRAAATSWSAATGCSSQARAAAPNRGRPLRPRGPCRSMRSKSPRQLLSYRRADRSARGITRGGRGHAHSRHNARPLRASIRHVPAGLGSRPARTGGPAAAAGPGQHRPQDGLRPACRPHRPACIGVGVLGSEIVADVDL